MIQVQPRLIVAAAAFFRRHPGDGGAGRVMVRVEAGAVCGSMVGCPAYVLVDGKVTWRGMLMERADWPPR